MQPKVIGHLFTSMLARQSAFHRRHCCEGQGKQACVSTVDGCVMDGMFGEDRLPPLPLCVVCRAFDPVIPVLAGEPPDTLAKASNADFNLYTPPVLCSSKNEKLS